MVNEFRATLILFFSVFLILLGALDFLFPALSGLYGDTGFIYIGILLITSGVIVGIVDTYLCYLSDRIEKLEKKQRVET